MPYKAIFRQIFVLNFEKTCQTKVNLTWQDKHANLAGDKDTLKIKELL